MMTMPVARRAGEYQNHDVGPEAPDVIDDVAQHLIGQIPISGSVSSAVFEESEIDGAVMKYCSGSVNSPGCQQFLAADDPQLVALLRPDQVLAALAACERQVRCSDMPAER